MKAHEFSPKMGRLTINLHYLFSIDLKIHDHDSMRRMGRMIVMREQIIINCTYSL